MRTYVVIVVASFALLPSTARAQDSLQSAKDLYASAAYEDALKVLSRLQVSDPKPEVAQYRASCLIALGRTAEAEKAIASVVTANPSFVPDPAEVSPRLQELFARTRRQMVPEIARQVYLEGKVALDRKDRETAVAKFEAVVQLIDSGADASGSLSELRLLAAGFLDLSRAMSAPAAPAATASPTERNSAASTANKPVKAPEITPPVAIKQVMPAWFPSDNVSRQAEFFGSVRVLISATGKVESAEIVRPIHPAYDRLLLLAAKGWEYQPARSDGLAVSSEQLVQVQLKPRQ
jgi:tetratricopeptide (TPR) repeat protein